MQIINTELLDLVTDQAQKNARLRKNFNFHPAAESPSQRLLNALEPGTDLPVHRHSFTDETYILLRGRLKVLFFNNEKDLIYSEIIDPKDGKFGVNILAGQWHSLEVLESGTVIFEVKDGPYTPISEEDILY